MAAAETREGEDHDNEITRGTQGSSKIQRLGFGQQIQVNGLTLEKLHSKCSASGFYHSWLGA